MIELTWNQIKFDEDKDNTMSHMTGPKHQNTYVNYADASSRTRISLKCSGWESGER